MTTPNPYTQQPATAFWRSAVAERHILDIENIWQPRFAIDKSTRISTFGSCFAQHFGRELRKRGFDWVNGEIAPHAASEALRKKFGYDLFSARTGNIYTTSLLRQWLRWALEDAAQPGEAWQANGRVYDPFRPAIEPDGFESVAEMRKSRDVAVAALAHVVRHSDVFTFTLGLTECWRRVGGEVEYPICPGTSAGAFSAAKYEHVQQGFDEVWRNLRRAITLLRRARPGLKILLTVSPVPMTATATGDHVLVASTAAKSILRAVADAATKRFDFVDYFPGYELVSQPPARGMFYSANMRSVNAVGVEFVMQTFLKSITPAPSAADEFIGALGPPEPARNPLGAAPKLPQAEEMDALACEEEILAAFGPDGGRDA
ncbi:GSCFA domain-containing protein [Abyssibius alkaniclasticus]|uniref:GSCFA domain-containing protein n=1 Tax=Abyssibius alkaniclasticus TaxID=2881234 RepID=UPI00236335E5|nr:GSCFA domain-containing protein [Abyssibius alkaniclasticus]UPH71709.1 GSCFA domain-containing protein [Abyssibius alkaniclasticus]